MSKAALLAKIAEMQKRIDRLEAELRDSRSTEKNTARLFEHAKQWMHSANGQLRGAPSMGSYYP